MKNMKILCTTLAAVLVFSSCTRGGGESPAAGAPDDGGAAASSRPTQQETPAIVDAEGYWRANTLPDPVAEQVVRQPAAGGETSAKVQILSLDSDGQNARLVAAVLPPVDGAPISSPLGVAGSKGARQRPWVRLVDGGAQKLYEPLQANGAESRSSADPGDVQDIGEVDDDARKAACICSYGVNAADKDATGAPNRTNLFYVDFPAPAGASVDVLLGDGDAFFSQVPVSSGQRFEADELGRFSFINSGGDALPGRYGAGAKLRRIVDLDESVSSVTDSTVQEKKGTTNLSVGADVLFALDSDKLDARATKVLGSIAKKLATAAKGQTVTIEGHTDDQGAKDYNQGLSERRALAVEKVLRPLVEDAGITLRTKGYGQTGPRVPNKDTKGKPIEANRAKNRRVAFDFKAVAEVDPDIDTGKRLKDLPKMAPGASSGALATAELPTPKGGVSPKLTVDVWQLEDVGDYLKLVYSFKTASGRDDPNAFGGGTGNERALPFGPNPYATDSSLPSAANVALWDKGGKLLAEPIKAGGTDCLCMQSTSIYTPYTAHAAAQYMYALFPKDKLGSDTLTLRFAGTGQMEVKRGAVEPPAAQTPTDGGSGLPTPSAP